METINIITVDERQFQVRKFDARTGLKIAKLLVSKILPMLGSFLPFLTGEGSLDPSIDDTAWLDGMIGNLSLDQISHAIDLVDDNDLDKLINFSLSHCYEMLPAGPAQVLKHDGTYGVAGVEHDIIITLRLVVEAIQWGAKGFLDGKRWASIFKPIMGLLDSFQQDTSI